MLCALYILNSKLFSSIKVKDRLKNIRKMSDLSDLSGNNKNKKNTTSIFSFISVSNKFKANLLSSGIKLKAEEYIVFWVVVTILPMLLFTIIRGFSVISILVGLLFFSIPPVWMQISRRKRIAKFNNQLNDALLIIGNSLRSGFTFRHSLSRVAEDLPDPISEELRRVIREVNYGASINDSLGQLAKKMESKELEIINSAVIIQQRSGGNLAEIIDKVSETISERIKMKNKIKALTAQGRMSGIVIGAIPVFLAFMLYLINPGYMLTFFDSTAGIIILIFSFIWEVIGFIIINKMVDVKY